VFKQKRAIKPARGGSFSDHLAAVVDTGSLAEVATVESTEVLDGVTPGVLWRVMPVGLLLETLTEDRLQCGDAQQG
jgi:hypothetical protein